MSKKVNLKSVRENTEYYWNVTFPKLKVNKNRPDFIELSGELKQKEHTHDVFILKVKSANLTDNNMIVVGDPIELEWGTREKTSRWYGYVYSIERQTEISYSATRIICVGLSFYMKNETQRVMKNVTADKFARKIARVHKLKTNISKHPRVFPMINQAGQSDWQMLTKLAAQCGYAFRVENGTLVFKSYKELYDESKRNAPYFYYIDTPSDALGGMMTVYSFKPLISEKGPDLDGAALNRKISIIDKNGKVKKTKHKPKYKKYKVSNPDVAKYLSENSDPIFTKVVTNEVSVSGNFSKNVLSSMAIDQGFRYQAQANLAGNPLVRPYDVVYIDGLIFYGYWMVLEVKHIFGQKMSYELQVILGSDFVNEPYIETIKTDTRDLTVLNSREEKDKKFPNYTLEDSTVLSKIGREITKEKNNYVGNPLEFFGVEYSTGMYNSFPPNFDQYPDTPKWRVS